MSAFAERALTVIAPGPPVTGDALLGNRKFHPAGQRQDCLVLLASGARAPAQSEIKKCLRCTNTACLGKTVAAGPSDHRRTKQVGRHQAVCNRRISLQILMAKGPCGPGVGGKPVLILPAGDYAKAKGTRSRNQGAWGKGDFERPLRAGAHRSRPPTHLWLLSVRAESNIVPIKTIIPLPILRKATTYLPR